MLYQIIARLDQKLNFAVVQALSEQCQAKADKKNLTTNPEAMAEVRLSAQEQSQLFLDEL